MLGFWVFVIGLVASSEAVNSWIRGIDGNLVPDSEFFDQVREGQIVILGEVHGTEEGKRFQVGILHRLRSLGFRVHLGMEFLEWTQQDAVDDFRSGVISEQEFLQRVGWGGFDFGFYREQILFPQGRMGETCRAINAPRFLTREVAKSGIAGLPQQLSDLLPPFFELGSSSYRKRFEAVIGKNLTPEAMQRYFEAQSVWDDTMAHQIIEFFAIPSNRNGAVMVVIVGEFHVQYGGGLPDRLLKRAPSLRVWTISQVSEREGPMGLRPDENGLPRAHWIWLSP